jgi:membrane protein DedA with SNARE-associated domain
MVTQLLEQLAGFAIATIQSTGYVGIFLLMTLESALIPIPSEVTMPFSGYLASQGVFDFWLVVAAGGLGNLAGSLIAYYLGRVLDTAVLHGLIRRYGKFVLMSMEDYERGERWLREHGEIVTFTSRLLPAVRTFVSLPAGVARIPLAKFVIYTITGSLLWSGLLAYVGVKLGENWHSISDYFHKFDLVIGVAVVALVAFYIWHKWPRRSGVSDR